MLNIQTMVKPYVFKDGDKEIKTHNPTQTMYTNYTAKHETDNIADFINNIFGMMLYDEDQHYVEELPVQIKLVIIKDYFDFHAKQLEKVFPSSNTTKGK